MNNISMIGLDAGEVAPMRALLALLRHPDPVVGEACRETLRYLSDATARADERRQAS